MIGWWKNFWDGFLNNEAYFIARVRALVMTGAMIGVVEAKNIAEGLGLPGIEGWVRRAGVVCAGVSMLMRAGGNGDKAPETKP